MRKLGSLNNAAPNSSKIVMHPTAASCPELSGIFMNSLSDVAYRDVNWNLPAWLGGEVPAKPYQRDVTIFL
jgi:hypothetical protein